MSSTKLYKYKDSNSIPFWKSPISDSTKRLVWTECLKKNSRLQFWSSCRDRSNCILPESCHVCYQNARRKGEFSSMIDVCADCIYVEKRRCLPIKMFKCVSSYMCTIRYDTAYLRHNAFLIFKSPVYLPCAKDLCYGFSPYLLK